MDHRPNASRVADSLGFERLTRRSVIKRSIALAVAIPTIPTLLAACAETDDDEEDAAAADDDTDDEDEVTEEPEEEEEEDEDPEDVADDDDTDDDTEPAADGEPVAGGRLRVANVGEPPSLDHHYSRQTVVGVIVYHIFEHLFTWDEDLALTPELLDDWEVSEDELVYTMHLREGVLFHNGDEMLAEDVKASIERWAQIASTGAGLWAATDEIVEIDDYTIEIRLTQPHPVLPINLARQAGSCTIYPKEVMEAAPMEPAEVIGTGPYKFVEHLPDRYVLLERFEDYVSRDEPPSGYGGGKSAFLDEIEFVAVPDESARIAGLRAEDYHYLEGVTPDNFQILEGDPNVVAEILPPEAWLNTYLNFLSPLTENVTIRQAMQAALDHDEIAMGAYGQDMFVLQPSIMHEEVVMWHTEAGGELYNRKDPDTARELLEEAGYDGTPVRFMFTQEYADHFSGGQIVAQQLEDAGFEMDVQIYDWATIGERRVDPEVWDILMGARPFRIDPIQHPEIGSPCEAVGNWCGDEFVDVATRFAQTVDYEERFALFERIQEIMYEDAAWFKLVDRLGLRAFAPELKGLTPYVQLAPSFWEAWLDE